MAILNFGSLNIDFVYSVDHIVQPGETITSRRLDVYCGGKGLNQSIALARAGAPVRHAGLVGPDGDILLRACMDNGVDASLIRRIGERSGNAIIQVGANGQNSIVLFGGANRKNEKGYVDETLARFGAGDMLLLQNEVNEIAYMIDSAAAKGMRIILNPSPFDSALAGCDFSHISLFLMNEVEGEQMTGETVPDRILARMAAAYPRAGVVLTLGGRGVAYRDASTSASLGVYETEVVDTTAAGDTFTGYFMAGMVEGIPPARALTLASAAAAIVVSRPGAADSIPRRAEVERFLRERGEPAVSRGEGECHAR